MKLCCRLSTLAAASFFIVTPALGSQNEVSGSVNHWRGPSEQLWMAGYTRYFSELDNSTGALKINPYLQRVSNVSVGYSTYELADTLGVSGRWYINSDWMVEAQFASTDFDDVFARSESTNAQVQAGYNLTREWQIGGGLDYRESDVTFYDLNRDVNVPNKNAATFFTRYTNVKQGQGWDMQLAVVFNEGKEVTANARYFFSRGFSVEANYSNDDYNPGRLDLSADYWITDQLSLKAGVGFVLNSDAESPSDIMLGASYRF